MRILQITNAIILFLPIVSLSIIAFLAICIFEIINNLHYKNFNAIILPAISEDHMQLLDEPYKVVVYEFVLRLAASFINPVGNLFKNLKQVNTYKF